MLVKGNEDSVYGVVEFLKVAGLLRGVRESLIYTRGNNEITSIFLQHLHFHVFMQNVYSIVFLMIPIFFYCFCISLYLRASVK